MRSFDVDSSFALLIDLDVERRNQFHDVLVLQASVDEFLLGQLFVPVLIDSHENVPHAFLGRIVFLGLALESVHGFDYFEKLVVVDHAIFVLVVEHEDKLELFARIAYGCLRVGDEEFGKVQVAVRVLVEAGEDVIGDLVESIVLRVATQHLVKFVEILLVHLARGALNEEFFEPAANDIRLDATLLRNVLDLVVCQLFSAHFWNSISI